jgi:hypothetical protein
MIKDLIDRIAIEHGLDPKEVEKIVKAQVGYTVRVMRSDSFDKVRWMGLGTFAPNDRQIRNYLHLYIEDPDNCPMPELADRARDYIEQKGLWPKNKKPRQRG